MIESNAATPVQPQLSSVMTDSDVTVYFLDVILPTVSKLRATLVSQIILVKWITQLRFIPAHKSLGMMMAKL
jgi:hypothetical protein